MVNDNFIQTLMTQKADAPLSCYPEQDMYGLMCTICGYLNGDGGWIAVGVHKDGTAVHGVQWNATAVSSEVAKSITPMPLVYVQEASWQDETVLLVTVIKGKRSPYSFDGKYYIINSEGEAVVPDKDALSMLMRKSKVASSWETIATSGAEEEDLDVRRMNAVYESGRAASLIKPRIENGHDLLSECGLLDYGVVKNGAMALFGVEPTRFMHQCRCRIQVMLNGKTADQYEDVRILEGNVFDLIDQLRAYFTSTLPNIGSFSNSQWERHHKSIYPMDVLDEAIVNALIHRDMGDLSGEVQINIYREKMEIINSGEIPSGIIRGKNKILPHISELRNPNMAEVLYVAGLMEKTGRGLLFIYDRMKAEGYRSPEWQSRNGYTTLTMYSTLAELPKVPSRALEFLQHYEGEIFSRAQYEAYFHGEISEKTAKNDLSALGQNGKVLVEGAGPATLYRIVRS